MDKTTERLQDEIAHLCAEVACLKEENAALRAELKRALAEWYQYASSTDTPRASGFARIRPYDSPKVASSKPGV